MAHHRTVEMNANDCIDIAWSVCSLVDECGWSLTKHVGVCPTNFTPFGVANRHCRGLDSRYMISQLKPSHVKVLSLTTIATPHRGSAFADYLFKRIGMTNIPKLYKALNYFGFETGAFEQLTMEYIRNSFNPRTPDVEGVEYYSYGATLRPSLTSVFRKSHKVIDELEGPNDGLVSVASSRWGTYKGTLDNVSHLDLINWTNRLR
jgi:triacylglycerol lipase